MPLFSTGLNHTTATVDIRERLAFSVEELPAAVADLHRSGRAEEAVLVSTCNRTELYCIADSSEPLIDWLSQQRKARRAEIESCLFAYEGPSAVRHLLRVAAGLDSMVLGEPQILGQVKQAFQIAQQQQTVGHLLSRLFAHAFTTAKRIRTETEIGTNPLSIASVAVDLAERIFANLSERTALLIGAGETIELTSRHLYQHGLRRLVVANRNPLRAQQLASRFHGYGVDLADIGLHLAEADILISSTASPEPIVQAAMVRAALKQRRHQPMLIIDIAVPRDVDPGVAELADVYLYSIDDLKQVIDQNLVSRQTAANFAEHIIDEEVAGFLSWLRARDSVDVIRALRQAAEQAGSQTLSRARARLARGEDPQAVLDYLTHTLINRLLHEPSVRLQQAGANSEQELLDAARALFGLTHSEEESS